MERRTGWNADLGEPVPHEPRNQRCAIANGGTVGDVVFELLFANREKLHPRLILERTLVRNEHGKETCGMFGVQHCCQANDSRLSSVPPNAECS